MRCAVQFVIFIALAASTLGAIDSGYNVTSGLEDYTLLVGRQMQTDIDIGELQLATVKARHADRMESIVNQQQLVLQEVQQFDSTMLQQQAFSLSRKHCVQKYKSATPTYLEVNRNFTQCLNQAEVDAKYLTREPEQTLVNARSVRENEVPMIFYYCNQTYTAQSYLEKCVTERVDMHIKNFNWYMDYLAIKLSDSLYASSGIATEANHCTFVVEKKVLTANGAVSKLADNCVEDLERYGVSRLAIESGNVVESKLMQGLLSRRNLIN